MPRKNTIMKKHSNKSIDPAAIESNNQLSQSQLTKALAKADLLRLYTETINGAVWGKKAKARKDFMLAYNSGAAWPLLLEIIGKISWKTIEGWKIAVSTSGDIFELFDLRGHWRRGQRIITDEQAAIMLRCVLKPDKPPISESVRTAREEMKTKGIDNVQSESTYRRWIEAWRRENTRIWTFARDGAIKSNSLLEVLEEIKETLKSIKKSVLKIHNALKNEKIPVIHHRKK